MKKNLVRVALLMLWISVPGQQIITLLTHGAGS